MQYELFIWSEVSHCMPSFERFDQIYFIKAYNDLSIEQNNQQKKWKIIHSSEINKKKKTNKKQTKDFLHFENLP